ncbi:hypothetical protein NP233_g5407 [Leucocoprinus birnbaumii]|uniref:FAD-binding domain-containing protein n=1 Tax=Leucocoprinus birnbaumii TaxID=56174 RepID=A0AAD5YWS5_9AGAR|nr:hypothetical protein NP233_g5407 [Leucocoprinus birnbaumii]
MGSAKIAIVGGGPGGLTLARLLKLQGIPFRLFELGELNGTRSQGGTLDIHKESGQMALKAAGLFNEFEKHARREGAALKVLSPDGNILFTDDGLNPEGSDLLPPDRPEIDRRDLRKILLESLDKGTIEWGKKVIRIVEDEGSTKERPRFSIEFEDGAKDSGFELVVGADGAWSRVRGLLTNEKPFYSGITAVEAWINQIDNTHPDLAERVGQGMCVQASGISSLISQRNTDGSVRTFAMISVKEDWATTSGIDWKHLQGSKKAIIHGWFSDWENLGKEFVLRSDGPLAVRPLYMLPVEMQWKTQPGITLIGDAAHLMTPFTGVGVNLALTDALGLSEAIRSHFQDGSDWETSLGRFEGKMFARSHIEARKTFMNMKSSFSGESVGDIMKKFGESMTATAAEYFVSNSGFDAPSLCSQLRHATSKARNSENAFIDANHQATLEAQQLTVPTPERKIGSVIPHASNSKAGSPNTLASSQYNTIVQFAMGPQARIAIIGGGPGGLMLARLLKLQGVPFRLFELDSSPESRSQGGTLDIHKDSGQMAVKAAGLFEAFEKHARREAAAMKMLDKDGVLVWETDGQSQEGSDILTPDRPEIDRRDLRKMLLESLDEGTVEWGRKVIRIVEGENSTKERPQFSVEFDGGEMESDFELVVGADGAWSRVRGLLTNEKPFYANVTFVEACINDVDAKHPDLAERVGQGSCSQAHGNSATINHRISDGSVRTNAAVRVEHDWVTTCGIDWTDVEECKHAFVKQKFGDWEQLSKGFILRSDTPLAIRPLFMLPVEMNWETRPGVTVLGDAAHLMTPFAGVGVNLALTDALDLSEAIRSRYKDNLDWTIALQEFESKMLSRSNIAAKRTLASMNNFFSGKSMQEIVKRLGEIIVEGKFEEGESK